MLTFIFPLIGMREDLHIMNSRLKEHTMKMCGHQEFMPKIRGETILLAVVNAIQNWTITRVITMTHAIMKTLVNTEITGMLLNRI